MAGSIGQPTIGWLPWQGVKSVVGTWSRNNLSDNLGMGYWTNDTVAQNDEFTVDVWMDAGTWKLASIGYTNTNRAILDYQLNGVSIGTLDWYSASLVNNVYKEIAGITVATAGLKTLKVIASSKNASSSGFVAEMKSLALIKTAGAHSTPAGTDTPGYTWQYLPWMGSKANTNFATRNQNSGHLGGGWLQSSGAQNDEVSWDIWLDAGTYKYAHIHRTGPNVGIYHIQLGGVDKGTIQGYDATGVLNTYNEIAGISVATAGVYTFTVKMASKHASASAYEGNFNSVAWIRTGA